MSSSRQRGERGKVEPVVTEGLAFLGLTSYEIRVYDAILRNPQSRVPEIARESRVPQPKVYSTVRRLLERGLLENHLGPVNEYSALEPQEAFSHLVEEVRERQSESEKAIDLLQHLHENAGEGLSQREGRVKLFQSRAAAARAFRELVQRVNKEVLIVVRFPLVTAEYLEEVTEIVEKGGQARLLCEIPDPTSEEHREFAARAEASGAQIRHTGEVPTRMAVFDERILALPMNDLVPEQGDGFMMLEIRNTDLARSFGKIFDMLWGQGRDF